MHCIKLESPSFNFSKKLFRFVVKHFFNLYLQDGTSYQDIFVTMVLKKCNFLYVPRTKPSSSLFSGGYDDRRNDGVREHEKHQHQPSVDSSGPEQKDAVRQKLILLF